MARRLPYRQRWREFEASRGPLETSRRPRADERRARHRRKRKPRLAAGFSM